MALKICVAPLLCDLKLFMEKSPLTLDLKRLPPIAAQEVQLLLDRKFVNRHENMLIFRPPQQNLWVRFGWGS
jgi:hypothetical protein